MFFSSFSKYYMSLAELAFGGGHTRRDRSVAYGIARAKAFFFFFGSFYLVAFGSDLLHGSGGSYFKRSGFLFSFYSSVVYCSRISNSAATAHNKINFRLMTLPT